MDRVKLTNALALATAVTAGLVTISEYEKRTLTTSVYRIKATKHIDANRTFVFLSDLHDNSFGEDNSRLLSTIDKYSPDAVLIGGDMMVCKKHCNTLPTLELCEKLSQKYQVYYGNGNHETRMMRERYRYGDIYDEFSEALIDMGVHHLSDKSATLDDDIVISGLNITEPYYSNFVYSHMNKTYITNRLGEASKDKYQILLTHSPLFLEAYASWGADLALAGHFHGGTVRLGKEIGLMTPQFQFFSDKVVGLRKIDNTNLIISPGLGTHSVNIRINNKPQVVVVTIEK